MIKILLVAVVLIFVFVSGALFCRRNLPLVEKAVAIAKKLIKKIKNLFGDSKFDGEKYVVGLVLKNIDSHGALRREKIKSKIKAGK